MADFGEILHVSSLHPNASRMDLVTFQKREREREREVKIRELFSEVNPRSRSRFNHCFRHKTFHSNVTRLFGDFYEFLVLSRQNL